MATFLDTELSLVVSCCAQYWFYLYNAKSLWIEGILTGQASEMVDCCELARRLMLLAHNKNTKRVRLHQSAGAGFLALQLSPADEKHAC